VAAARARTRPVALVAHVRDAIQLLGVHHLRDALHEVRLRTQARGVGAQRAARGVSGTAGGRLAARSGRGVCTSTPQAARDGRAMQRAAHLVLTLQTW
jgi:hypothetical protein